MTRKYFGTDGIRGKVGEGLMTADQVLKLGWAAGRVFASQGEKLVVIGKDTRISGYMLESALEAGLSAAGVEVRLLGPMPTPAVALITRSLRADAGVIISASHNPYEDNGIKFFSREGFKLPDEIETEIERLIESGEIDHFRPTAQRVGKAFRIDDAVGRYIEFVKTSIPKGMTFDGIRVVVDCANGAIYKVAPAVLSELGECLLEIDMTHVLQSHGDESGVEEVQYRVLLPADVTIHRKPPIGDGPVHGDIVPIGGRVPKEVPGGVQERVGHVGLTPRLFSALRAVDAVPLLDPGQRADTRVIGLEVFDPRQHHG